MKKRIPARFLAASLLITLSDNAAAIVLEFNGTNLGMAPGSTANTVSMTRDGIEATITAYKVKNDGSGNITRLSHLTGSNTGVYLSSNTGNPNLGVVSNSKDGHDLDGGDGSNKKDKDEGIMIAFSERVHLEYVNFDDFSGDASGTDDFNLTVDGVLMLLDYSTRVNPDALNYELAAAKPATSDEYTFNNITGREFLFWADGDNDDFRIDDMRVSRVTAVPEPSTLLLFGVGLIGLAVCRRKRPSRHQGHRGILATT